MPQTEGFVPLGGQKLCQSCVTMTVDEYETIRLIDLEQLTQEQCASQMQIARTTVTGIYNMARRKLADALVNGKRLMIEGGQITICEQQGVGCDMAHATHCCKRNKKETVILKSDLA